MFYSSSRFLHVKVGSRRAFTLVEILIVIAISIMLMAIVIPVLSKAKERAKYTTDASNLRQLGIARSIYCESQEPCWLRSTIDLDSDKSLHGIQYSALDKHEKGQANVILEYILTINTTHTGIVVPTYKRSYSGTLEFGVDKTFLEGESRSNIGWLVNTALAKGPDAGPYFSVYNLVGNYQRLLLDGSVQTRHTSPIYIENGKGCLDYSWFFSDLDYEKKVEYCRSIVK